MDLVEFIDVIRKWKWIIISIVLVAGIYTTYNVLKAEKTYSAESEIVIGQSQIASMSPTGINIMQNADRLGATYGEMITDQPVMEKALDKSGVSWSVDNLRARVSLTSTKNAPIMNVTVVDNDPERTVILTNAVSDAFVEYLNDSVKAGIESSQTALTNELAAVEKQLAAAKTDPAGPNDSRIKALEFRRDLARKGYETLFEQQVEPVDVRVASPANIAYQSGTTNVQNYVIALSIALIVGVIIAFIAEAIRKSLFRL